MHQQHEFRDDVFYEPRALWDIASITAGDRQAVRGSVPSAAESRVLFDQNHFRNGSRHTLVLTHVLISGIGYLLMDNPDAQAIGPTTYNNATNVMNRCQVYVSAPGRVHMSQNDLLINAWSPSATGVNSGRHTPVGYASGMRGLSRWDFDFPFWLPNKGRVQFDLSTWLHPQIGGLGTAMSRDVRYAMGFNETPVTRGSYKTGNANRQPGTFRYRGQVYGQTALPVLQPAGDVAVWPAGRNPFPADAFGGLAVGAPQGTFTMWNHGIPSTTWDEQEADRGASHKEISGYAVMIDQIAYDDRIQGSGVAAVVGQRVTPLAHKVATRAKCTNGGTNEYWWRPGCPLSLVSPTVGSALVHKLDDPYVLGKGDALSVEVQAPLLSQVAQLIQAGPPTYNIGVSFCGYAMIEG